MGSPFNSYIPLWCVSSLIHIVCKVVCEVRAVIIVSELYHNRIIIVSLLCIEIVSFLYQDFLHGRATCGLIGLHNTRQKGAAELNATRHDPSDRGRGDQAGSRSGAVAMARAA